MLTDYEIWNAELAGKKTKRSGWWLVAVGAAVVAAAVWMVL